jgi:hypothetical protein
VIPIASQTRYKVSILGYKVLLLKKSVNKEKLKDISEEIEEI